MVADPPAVRVRLEGNGDILIMFAQARPGAWVVP
jgi:hypothetical protein